MIKSILRITGISLMFALVGLTAGCGGGTTTGSGTVDGIPSAASISAVSAN